MNGRYRGMNRPSDRDVTMTCGERLDGPVSRERDGSEGECLLGCTRTSACSELRLTELLLTELLLIELRLSDCA